MNNSKKIRKYLKEMTKTMDVVIILDRSGSMYDLVDDTIGGFNSYIDENRDKDYNVTTVLFDDNYEVLYESVPIKEVKKLTKRDYFVRGSTALLDAIGFSINRLDENGSRRALIVVTTDGYENASSEFSKSDIRKMIKAHPNYEVIYVGANIDSYEEGKSFGIKECNISNYRKSSGGVHALFKSVSKAGGIMYEDCCLDASWKNDLENYSKEE